MEATPRKTKIDMYNASSYFIKNSTGEILLFKTTKQKAYNEIQADEEYPLDFQTYEKYI
jgi:hypothetical protein